MTTKTPTASLPVFTRCQCDTEEDFELFADHLSRWCAQWIPEISVPIMRNARDLYEDTAVCILLGKWYELKLKTTKDMHERLLRAANGNEWSWEREGEEDEFSEVSTLDHDALRAFGDALRALLIE